MPITTRVAKASDLTAIVEIYNQAVVGRATAHLEPVTVADRQQWFDKHGADYPLLVAVSGDTAVAWSSFSPYRPGRGALRHTAEISCYVHGAYHRQGIASALIVHSLELCPSLEFKTLFAILLDYNRASIALLEKFGFEQWAYMPGVADFNGHEVGHLYYGRRIS